MKKVKRKKRNARNAKERAERVPSVPQVWAKCPNPHCGRLQECQNVEACGSKARPESALQVPWPDDADIGTVAAAVVSKLGSSVRPSNDPKPPKTKKKAGVVEKGKAPPRLKSVPGHTPALIERAVAAASPQLEALNHRQQLFVREYLVDLNGTQAAIRAGYSPAAAKETAYDNLTKPHIMAAIDAALMELGGITRARVVDELGAIAFADIGQIVTWDEEHRDYSEGDSFVLDGEEHLAKEGITRVIRQRVRMMPSVLLDPAVRRVISEVHLTEKGALKIKLCDKSAALDKLARALGMYQEIDDAQSTSAATVAVTVYEGRDSRPARREPPPEAVGND